MKKMVINHLDKIFVTSDTATMMKEVSSLKRWKLITQQLNFCVWPGKCRKKNAGMEPTSCSL